MPQRPNEAVAALARPITTTSMPVRTVSGWMWLDQVIEEFHGLTSRLTFGFASIIVEVSDPRKSVGGYR